MGKSVRLDPTGSSRMRLLFRRYRIRLTRNSEAWRYTGPFSRANRFKGSFPGFGIAVVAFTAYVVADNMLAKTQKKEGTAHH